LDEFVDFNFVLLNASNDKVTIEKKGPRRERVDLIARQFHAFLLQGDQADTAPHGMVLTDDFKLRRQVGQTAGWLTFLVERDGNPEEVALVVFARANDQEGREALLRLERFMKPESLPPAPLIVAVKLVPKVPLIISEWFGKSAAGFFTAFA
jgi:hypothetical protein